MASIMGAAQTKYDTLTLANFPGGVLPPRFEDRAPEVWNGSQLYPPYVLFQLITSNDILTFESDAIEESRLIVTAYANTQADADAIMHAIRYNGQTVGTLAGFDCGSLPSLTDGTLLSMIPRRPPQPAQVGRGKEGPFRFRTAIEYEISVQRS